MSSPQREATAQRPDLPQREAQQREAQQQREAAPQREAPPPLEGNDQLITMIITAAWALALIVLLSLGHNLPSSQRWWIWTCVTGVGLGLFGVVYVPFLKRSRARAAERRSGGGAT
jgi:fatty acid desaturase